MWLFGASFAFALDDLTALSDEFDSAGSLANWSRIYQTEGWNNNVLVTFDANTSRPGQLVMTPVSSTWFGEWRGELTYKTVTGDFVITTFVEPRNRAGTGRPESDYSLAGIMVRTPRAMTSPAEWTQGGQNYVFLSLGSADRGSAGYEFEVKTTVNSISTLFIEPTPATRATIQVARLGSHLIMLRRNEGGAWVVHRRYQRPDFPATLQAGLTVYTDWDTCSAVGTFDNNHLVLTNGARLSDGGTLSGATPDLVAAFDYVRFARPQVPVGLVGADFSNPGAVSDAQLLTFLGEPANVPGGAVVSPAFNLDGEASGGTFRVSAVVVSNRTYRLQSASSLGGGWSEVRSFVSTNTLQFLEQPVGPEGGFFRLTSP
ncbi:MAG TPA: hypothetical protein DCY13_19305 [Verrucomicrobiales bacterium]|nr:hypothetical protein [Verrucomicrobiales bacterium]